MTESMDLERGSGRVAFLIARKLREAGHSAFFAGGCVRDFLMGIEPADFDIATSAHPDQIEGLFPRTVPVGKQFGVILVLEDGVKTEVATFRRDESYGDGRHPDSVSFTDAAQDARRRDFTVNGLFYDPFESKTIDYVDGVTDIRARMIRAIGEPGVRFEEDKLRLLRAVRFASTLDFQIEHQTWRALVQKAVAIRQVSAERIREELVKIFTRPHAGRGFELLFESGLMAEILPELSALKGVGQPPAFHPEGDVFRHTRLMLDLLKNPSAVLAFSVLFHDIGKPQTYCVRDGRITFYEHAGLGAAMAEKIMRRLRFSNGEIENVKACVENHMRFGDVQRMRAGKLKQLIVRPTFGDELELHRIDCMASHGMLDNYHFLIDQVKRYAQEDLKPKRLVNGYDLMDLGMKAGPAMKTVLEEVYELQLEGTVKTKDEALEAVRGIMRRTAGNQD